MALLPATSSIDGSTGSLPTTLGSMVELQHSPLRLMQQMHREHGDIFAFDNRHNRVVFVVGPTLNREVMGRPEIFQACFFPVRGPKRSAQRRLSSGLISMNGEEHKKHRRLITTVFQKRAFKLYEQPILEILERMLSKWQAGQVRDIHTEMTQFMLDVTSRILFGIDESGLAQQAGRMIDRWVAMNHRQAISVLDPNHVLGRDYQDLLNYAESLEAVIREIIALRRRCSGGDDLMSLLIQVFNGPGSEMTEDQFIGHASLLFAAAHLTTAHSLTWALFLLTQHVNVQSQLRNRLGRETDDKASPFVRGDSCRYLNQVITESMRILPASCYVHRAVTRSVKLGPFQLHPGAAVAYSQFLTHHSSQLYDRPASFNPERWAQMKPVPYEYIPFGTGPRMCIGGPLAMVIIQTVLSEIVQRFGLEFVAQSSVDYTAESTMLGPAGAVPIRLTSPRASLDFNRARGPINDLLDLPCAAAID